MKMKKTINIKCLALMLGLFAMTASCTNDDLTNGETKDNKQINGTVFVGGKSSASDSTKTRTGLEFLYSRSLKTIFQHKACTVKLYADSFYKVQKNSHSSFEVICCRS